MGFGIMTRGEIEGVCEDLSINLSSLEIEDYEVRLYIEVKWYEFWKHLRIRRLREMLDLWLVIGMKYKIIKI